MSEGALFGFDWRFRGSEIVVRGRVDTEQDALFVHSYQATQSEPFPPYLAPDLARTDSFPDQKWKFVARRAGGSVYDIPSEWNGHISKEWGFISDREIRSIPFVNGSYANDDYPWTIYPGFAGYKLVLINNNQPPSAGGNEVSHESFPPGAKYGTMFGGAPLENTWAYSSGTLRVTRIPEPSAILAACFALTAVALQRWSLARSDV